MPGGPTRDCMGPFGVWGGCSQTASHTGDWLYTKYFGKVGQKFYT